MNKVKITVLKTTLDKELAAEYGAEGRRVLLRRLDKNAGRCSMQLQRLFTARNIQAGSNGYQVGVNYTPVR